MAEIIDGKKIAQEIREGLAQDIEALRRQGCTPGLSVVLVGDNPASQIYVRMKTRACEELGIRSHTIRLPADIAQAALLARLEALNRDPAVHGILVQLPLPEHISEEAVINAVSPGKDVDGFHPVNRGKLVSGEETFIPCTPYGVQEMLIRSGNPPDRKHVVILGRSKIVGLPLANLLLRKQAGANATVTVCHSGTPDVKALTRQADILVAAIGVPQFVQAEMVKPGAVVIDVGVNRVPDATAEKGYRIVGDVAFGPVSEVAGAISPVPGGVGPMTIAMLMVNTVKAATLSCASSSTG